MAHTSQYALHQYPPWMTSFREAEACSENRRAVGRFKILQSIMIYGKY